MGKGADSPPLPDYGSIIPLQANANTNQFLTGLNASRINSVTPWGSTTWFGPGMYGGAPGGNQGPDANPPTFNKPQAVPGAALGPNGWMRRSDASGDPAGGDGPSGGAGAGGGEGSGAAAPGSSPGDVGAGTGGGNGTGLPNNGMTPDAGTPGGGGLSWDQILGRLPNPSSAGPWTAVTSLSPDQQKLFDTNTQVSQGRLDAAKSLMGGMSSMFGGPQSFMNSLPTYDTAYNTGTRNAAEKAYYDRSSRYFEPQVEKDRAALQDRLVQQGLNVGSSAYDRALQSFEDTTARSRADMRDQAILGGGTEATGELSRTLSAQNQGFNQALQRAGVGAQDRTRSLNELASLLQGTQVTGPNTPLTVGAGGSPGGVDILGAAQSAYGQQLGAANASAAADSNMWNGLLGALASYAGYAAMAGCDRRLKADIEAVGDGFYTFRYLGGTKRYFGRMAEDVPAERKRLVNGFWYIDAALMYRAD